MEFCNKGMVRDDPLPPSYGQRPYFDHFIFWDPFLRNVHPSAALEIPSEPQAQAVFHSFFFSITFFTLT